MTAPGTLPVAEVFGPTVQGEGPAAGRPAAFLRLGGCNLTCSWCDSAFTWDRDRYDLRTEITDTPPDQIADRILATGARLVIITGGEPMIHQSSEEWTTLLDRLVRAQRRVEIETNGTIAPLHDGRINRWVVSPKLGNSGVDPRRAVKPRALQVYRALAAEGRAVLKLVCGTPGDVDESARFAAEHGFRADRVWISPLGTTPDQVVASTAAIASPTVAAGMNLGTRLHVLAWGSERGR